MEKETIELVKRMIEDGNLSEEVAMKYCPELKESEDERIRKWLICTLKSLNNSPVQIDGAYEMMLPSIAWLEKQGEQKLADKVEPKFKVGDWIVSETSNLVYYVDSVLYPQSKCYYLSYNGSIVLVNFADAKNYHLWTIQDAKDGDVLSYRDGQWVFIYKGIVTENTFKYYALLSEKGICVNDSAFSLLTSCIIPATKEQHDTLMKAMADAGYTFDFEKKELKKIEQKPTEDVNLPEFESYLCLMLQKFRTKGMCTNGEIIDYVKEHSQKLREILVKPAWSEEDDVMINKLLAVVKLYYDRSGDDLDKQSCISFLKSLKSRVQPKQEWSEEDEEIINKISVTIATHYSCDTAVKVENWLKSLRPQKPLTNEEIEQAKKAKQE